MPNAVFDSQIRQTARAIALERETSGRALALASLFDLTSERLVRFATSITRRQHDAEDAVSTTMVKIAGRPNLLIGAERPWNYLLQMVRNESLVILRSRSRWSALGTIAERLVGKPTDLVERDDENRVIWDALASLPAAQREVVVLKIWEQLTFAEIADVLRITPSTAASRYRYALEKLSFKLGADQQHETVAKQTAKRPAEAIR